MSKLAFNGSSTKLNHGPSYRTGALAVGTPAIVELDLAPADAEHIAKVVFHECHELLGGTDGDMNRLSDMDLALMRLRI